MYLLEAQVSLCHVRFWVLTAENLKMTAVWDIAPCSIDEVNVSEVHTAFIIRAMMMEAERTCEMLVYFKETTQHCIPEGCHLQLSDFSKNAENHNMI
jgi:hypothetical protein